MTKEDLLREALRTFGSEPAFGKSFTQAIGCEIPVAVINLAHRIDRWQSIEARLASVGLDKPVRYRAIDGRKLPLEAIVGLLGQPLEKIESAPRSHFTLTRPAIGCFLSHLGLWQTMIDCDIPRMLIFEDDARPTTSFDQARFRIVVDRREGLVFLGCMIMDGLADEPSGAELARLYFFNGTFAYLITQEAARALMLQLQPLNGHIDHQISSVLVRMRHEFAAYRTEPQLFEPDWSLRSDCYVPLSNESEADRELGTFFSATRHLLLAEGKPLLAPFLRDAG